MPIITQGFVPRPAYVSTPQPIAAETKITLTNSIPMAHPRLSARPSADVTPPPCAALARAIRVSRSSVRRSSAKKMLPDKETPPARGAATRAHDGRTRAGWRLGNGSGQVNRRGPWRVPRPPCRACPCLTDHQIHRESRSGAAAVRVFHMPSGVLYFSPGLVCPIRLQPLANASCSTVAPLAVAFCV